MFDMGKKPNVVLYGASLVMSGLAASLENETNLSLYQLKGCEGQAAPQLAALHPDVVIFDLAAGPPDNAFLLLWEQSQVLLIGVDLNRHTLLQWAGQQARAQTTQDVVQAIQHWTELKSQ
jgi:hypothetical protein